MVNEVRLIDANALARKWQDVLDSKPDEKETVAYLTFELFIERLKDEPTIDPESLRPKGRWTENRRVGFSDAIEGDVYWFTYTCSECGGVIMNDYHYCPNCGAKMMEG